ncbi:hypothetical protein Tco_0291871 [Tanacetum coccineum]
MKTLIWTKSLKNPDSSILKKLDRMMVNDEFLKVYYRAHGVFLPFLVSDHNAAVMIFPEGLPKKVKSFRFTNYIAGKHELLDIVRKGWEEEIRGCQMFKVVKKLKSLKKPLNQLNWKHGNLFDKANALRDKLKVYQKEVENDPFNKEKRCATIKTLEEYSKLGDIVQKKLSIEDAEEMIVEVTDKEIKDAIFDIDSAKDSGLDGYTSCFFKKAYDIIGKEVCAAVREFFTNGRLLGEINSTLIVLVLKIETPNKISDFRPIACCNVLYKCISNILINKIKNGLSKAVSINQSAFILGRHVQDNILLTQELLRGV